MRLSFMVELWFIITFPIVILLHVRNIRFRTKLFLVELFNPRVIPNDASYTLKF